VIRCSHCGKLAPTGAMSCQNCGMPLVNSGAGGVGAGQAEQELPAWLESLRAHERPAPSGQENRQPFSLDELVDEDSMPSWMRQDRRKMPENGNSDSFPAMPAMPVEASQEQQITAANGFQAGSLIDERSLPTWMRENQAQGGEQPGMAQNVSAHSLVDQQGLPSWIKDLSQAAQTPAPASNQYGLPAQTQTMNQYGLPVQTPITPPSLPSAPRVPQTPPANEPPIALSHGFSAHDLLDVQSMPSWMSGAQGPGQGPGSQPPTRPVPTDQGFSAGELIDQRSVPAWMKDLQGQEKSTPQSAMGVPVSGSGQMTGMGQGIQGTMSGEGMPAGSLLDRNSMPTWMQESQLSSAPQANEQGMAAGSLLDANAVPPWMQGNQPNNAPQANEQGMSAGSLLDVNSMPAWMRESAQGSAPQGSLPAEQGMAAGSLLDMNSMPAWLRNADSGQPGAGIRTGQPQARPVPSRPRNEMAPQEQSEVAANVFASMLGVAASAPALPGQEQTPANNLGVAQGQPMPSMPPFQQAQPSLPGWQQPAMNQYNQGAQPQMWQVPEAMPTMSPPPAPNAYAPVGQMGGPQQRANNAEQPAWAGYSAADRTALGVTAGMGAGNPNPGKAQPTDTKKKGFFDSIRDFFTK
jgi:hypothetical protein